MYRGIDDKNASTVLFADPPVLGELCVISVCVSGILKQVPATSRFQIQTIKCREIIFTEPDIIASPSLELDTVFQVILQISLYKTGRLQARLQKLGLEVSKPSYVTPKDYQSCLRYTLLAKLAPNWNKAGIWLIQGRDFLTSAGYANGIKMEVTVATEELYFTIDASTVRFPSLKLEDLDVSAACYNNFLQNQSAVIHQHLIPMVWCHVLPSMKKGTIVSISHSLPEDSPFKSYKDIKRHWKNHYGYRLPEDEEGMLYYQVNFRPLGEKLFTYPEVCLRARDIQRVPRVDPKPILQSFLQDLQKKMPKICGFSLKLHNKAQYPTIGLDEVTQVEKRPSHNLSSRWPNVKVVYRNMGDIERLVSQSAEPRRNTQSAQKNVPSYEVPFQAMNSYAQPRNSGLVQSQTNSHQNSNLRNNVSSQSNERHHNVNNASTSQVLAENYDNRNDNFYQGTQLPSNEGIASGSQAYNNGNQGYSLTKKIVPVFKPTIVTSNHMTDEQPKITKIVPVFKKVKQAKPLTQVSELRTGIATENSQIIETESVNTNELRKQVPVFSARQNQNVVTKSFNRCVNPSPGQANKNLSALPNQSKIVNKSSNVDKSSCVLSGTIKNTSGPIRNYENMSNSLSDASMRTPIHSSSNMGSHGFALPPSTPKFQKPVGLGLSTPKPRIAVPSTPKSCKSTSSTPCSTPASMKRTLSTSREGTPSVKKPRPKQQVKDVDVEMLARSNQLNKVNTVTLVNWLKERGVSCKSKDKKGDLVEKAMKLLNLSVSEQ